MLRRDETIRNLLAAVHDPARPPLLMGVLNVTPDSFSDGGQYRETDQAIAHGLAMAAAGADILDVGGESTRSGAAPVGEAEELDRVIPVIRALVDRMPMPISVDTRRTSVAQAALDAGAVIVNDVSCFRQDHDMAALLGRERPIAVAMHMRGQPSDMQARTDYQDLLPDCVSELWSCARQALDAGLPRDHLWLDPGIGFAKDAPQCVTLLAHLDSFVSLGLPVLVGVSRKTFIGHLTGVELPSERLLGTAAAVSACVLAGARIVRVHDVGAMRQVVAVAHAIRAARAPAFQPREVRP